MLGSLEVLWPGIYRIKWIDGKMVLRSWNADLLRPYYE